MNYKGPCEGYSLARCLLPAFLCMHIFIEREMSGYEAEARHWNWRVQHFTCINQYIHKSLQTKLGTCIHKPLCSENMCFPQQQLVLHWLSLLTYIKLNPHTLPPVYGPPIRWICSRSTREWITLKLQADFYFSYHSAFNSLKVLTNVYTLAYGLKQLGERQSAKGEVTHSNYGWTNTQMKNWEESAAFVMKSANG